MKHFIISSLFLLTEYEKKTLREKWLDGEIAQQGKHLLHKHEDLSLGPWDPYKARHSYMLFNMTSTHGLSHVTCTSTYRDMNTHIWVITYINIYTYINTYTIHIHICTHQAYTPSLKKIKNL